MAIGKLFLRSMVVFGVILSAEQAGASQANPQPAAQDRQAAKARQSAPNAEAPPARARRNAQGSNASRPQAERSASRNPAGISCVPYVRQATGMAIRGNGGDWWNNAAGLYARGHKPEPGAVMAFPRTNRGRAGHVAVVQEVISAREVLIHHANWAGPGIRPGSIMRDVSVIDVSLKNDWSAVRVQVGHDRASAGRIYPVQGFIYDRPDNGYVRTAASPRPGGALLANARSLRPDDVRGFEELAQAPARR